MLNCQITYPSCLVVKLWLYGFCLSHIVSLLVSLTIAGLRPQDFPVLKWHFGSRSPLSRKQFSWVKCFLPHAPDMESRYTMHKINNTSLLISWYLRKSIYEDAILLKSLINNIATHSLMTVYICMYLWV